MQEDFFMCLFIYVFLFQTGVKSSAELINVAYVLCPLWVNAATHPRGGGDQIVWPPNLIIYPIFQLIGQN